VRLARAHMRDQGILMVGVPRGGDTEKRARPGRRGHQPRSAAGAELALVGERDSHPPSPTSMDWHRRLDGYRPAASAALNELS